MAERKGKSPRIIQPSVSASISPSRLASVPQHRSPAVLYPLRNEWNTTGQELIANGRYFTPSQEVILEPHNEQFIEPSVDLPTAVLPQEE